MQKYARLRVFNTRGYVLTFTKLSANVDRLVGLILKLRGSLKGRCYGNRFVAHVGKQLTHPSSFSSLAFDNCCENRKTDETFTADEPCTSCKNFVNFGSVTSEIFWCVLRRVGTLKYPVL